PPAPSVARGWPNGCRHGSVPGQVAPTGGSERGTACDRWDVARLGRAMREPQRILIYRIGQIGDMVIALPSLWAIRRHFPSASLTLLRDAHARTQVVSSAEVLPASGLIEAWLCYATGTEGTSARAISITLRSIRRGRFDALVYLAPRRRPAVR